MADQSITPPIFPTAPGLAQSTGISKAYTPSSIFPLGNPSPFLLSPLQGAAPPQINPPTSAGAALLAAPPAPPDPHGIGGFLVNLGRDVTGVVHGVGTLVGMGFHDTAKALSEAATLGHADWGGGYMADDLVKALPAAIAGDYSSRYGGWSKFVHGLYEHPLSFLSDALTVATVGGWAAASGAAAVAKAADAATVVADAARVAQLGRFTEAAAKLGTIPDYVRAALPGYRIPEGLAEGRPAAVQALKSQAEAVSQGYHAGFSRIVMRGNDPVKVPAAINPIRRTLWQPLQERIVTRPFQPIGYPYGMEGPGPGGRSIEEAGVQGAATRQALKFRQDLAEAAGATREYRPFFENRAIRGFTDSLFGNQSTSWLYRRNAVMKEFEDFWKGVSEDERPSWALAIQGLDSVPLALRPAFEQMGGAAGVSDIPRVLPPTASEEASKIPIQFDEVPPEQFVAARAGVRRDFQPYLSMYTADEIKTMGARAFMSPDGNTGYLLKPDGEIANVFNTEAGVRGAGTAAVLHGIKQLEGTNIRPRVEHFEGKLGDIYGHLGFQPSERFPFDPAELPTGPGYDALHAVQPDYVVRHLEGGLSAEGARRRASDLEGAPARPAVGGAPVRGPGTPTPADRVAEHTREYAFPFQFSQEAWVRKRADAGIGESAAVAEHRAAVEAALEEGNHIPYWSHASYPDLPGGARKKFQLDMINGLGSTNVPATDMDLPFYFFDKMAEGAARVSPEQFASADDVYRLLSAQFKDQWTSSMTGLAQRRSKVLAYDMKQLLDDGKVGKDWYETSNHALAAMAKAMGSGHSVYRATKQKVRDFDLLLQLVAVTSPQRRPLDNLSDALRVMRAFKEGRAIPQVSSGSIMGMVHDVLDGRGPRTKEWQSIAFAQPVSQQTRQKVTDYHAALSAMTELDRKAALPVIDTWMGRIFGYGPYGDFGKLTKRDYREVQDMVMSIAKENGITPVEAQARLWTGFKSRWAGAMRRDTEVLQRAHALAQANRKTAAIRELNKLEGRRMSMYEDIQSKLAGRYQVLTHGLFGLDHKVRPEYITADNIQGFIDRAKVAGRAEAAGGYELGLTNPKIQHLIAGIRDKNLGLKQMVGEIANGVTTFGEDGHAIMTFFHTADTSTFVHEGAHALRRFLDDESISRLAKHYNTSATNWSVGAEETWASDVERYFASGQAPRDMMGIFARLKASLAAVWAKFREAVGDGVHEDVRQVLDRWFAPSPNPNLAADGGLSARVYRIWPTQAQAQLEIARRFAKTAGPEELARVNKLAPLDQALLLETVRPPKRGLLASLDPLNRAGVSDGELRRSLQAPYESTLAGEPFDLDLTAFGEGVQADITPTDISTLDGQAFLGQLREVVGGNAVDRLSWREALADPFVQRNSKAQAIVHAVVGDWGDVPQMIDSMSSLGERVGLYNGVRTPHELGFRGINVDIRTPEGHVVQVRIQTPTGHAVTEAIGARGGLADRWSNWVARREQLQAELQTVDPETGEAANGRTAEVLQADLELANIHIAKGQAAIQNNFTPAALEQKESFSATGPDGARLYTRSAGDLAMEQTRIGVLRHLTTPLIRNGQLDLAGLFDRDYLPMRIASGAHYDSKVSGFTGGLDPMDINRARQAAHLSPPFYFPLIDPNRTRYSDFLISRQAIGAMNAARSRYTMRATGRLIEKGSYITDPVLVYQRRAAMALRHTETYNFVRAVAEHFGRPIQSAQDVSPGEVLFAPDGLFRMFHSRIYTEDAMMRAVAAGTDDPEALKNVLDEIMPVIHGHIAYDGVSVTKQGIPLYAIPKVVGERLQAFTRYRLGPGARIFWDGPTNLWRGLVLMGSPRWMVNNLIGNMIFLKLQGGGLTDLVRAMMPKYRALIDSLPEDATARINTGLYGSASSYVERVGAAAGRYPRTVGAIERVERSRPYKLAAIIGRGKYGTRAINEHIENAFRRASYLRAAERVQVRRNVLGVIDKWRNSARYASKVQEVGGDEVLREAAMREMNYFLNDYTSLSPFERNVVRRFVAPFWGFYRHIFRLMFTLPARNPVRFNAFRALTTAGAEITSGYGPLPSWMQGDVAIGPGGQPGDVTFLSTSGPNPFNVLTSNPFSWLHPFWKIGFEETQGRSALTGKEFTAPDVITPYGSNQSFRVGPNGTIEPIDRVAPGLGEEALRQFPQYQLLEQLTAGGATYDTSTLLGDIGARLGGYPPGGAVLPGTEPGTAKYPVDAIQNFMRILGYSTFDYNPAKYQVNLASNEASALADWIKSQGLAPTQSPLTVAHPLLPGLPA